MACASDSIELGTRLMEEIEFLTNVYTADEVSILYDDGGNTIQTVVMTIHPATAGNVDEQYVCLNLHVQLPQQYPDESPTIEMKNPRGLAEQDVSRLKEILNEYIYTEKGNPILLQLFELARDTLTNSNVPHGDCSICLSDFQDPKRQFIRTQCYHYFHSSCISKYKAHWEKSLVTEVSELHQHLSNSVTQELQFQCPDCRKPISLPNGLVSEDENHDSHDDLTISDDIKYQQRKWKDVFKKQQANGGIINLEQEKQKYRLPAPRLSPPSTPIPPATSQLDDLSQLNSKSVMAQDESSPLYSFGNMNLSSERHSSESKEITEQSEGRLSIKSRPFSYRSRQSHVPNRRYCYHNTKSRNQPRDHHNIPSQTTRKIAINESGGEPRNKSFQPIYTSRSARSEKGTGTKGTLKSASMPRQPLQQPESTRKVKRNANYKFHQPLKNKNPEDSVACSGS